MDELIIGVDCSTTACKAVVFDKRGEIIYSAKSALRMGQPQPSFHEQDANDWWFAFRKSILECCSHLNPNQFAGICFSCQRETFVPVNHKFEPVHPAILWMDERSQGFLPMVRDQLGETSFHKKTGKPITGNLAIGKLLWIKHNLPHAYQPDNKYLDVHAFLMHRLIGEPITSYSCADPLGLFNIIDTRWDADIISFLGIRSDQLPAVVPHGTNIGKISHRISQETGLPDGLPVIAGIGDGQAGGLGVNAGINSSGYLNLGTAVITGTTSDQYQIDRYFRTMMSGIPGKYNLEGVLLGGTYTISWLLHRFLGDFQLPYSEAEFEKEIQRIPVGSDGLMVVPYWNSVMNPYWDTAAKGMTIGWHGAHTIFHLYRAILEGIGYEIRLHTEGIEKSLGYTLPCYIAFGGGANSQIWCQIISNIINKEIRIANTVEASALGAAMIVAGSLGIYPNIVTAAGEMSQIKADSISPNPLTASRYDQFYEIYQGLFPAISKYMQQISKLIDQSFEEG